MRKERNKRSKQKKMKRFILPLVALCAFVGSAFAVTNDYRSSLELVGVRGKNNTRAGLGIPVMRETSDVNAQVSVWVLTQGSFQLTNLGNGSFLDDVSGLYLGAGLSSAIWRPSDQVSLRITGGWSGDFSDITKPKNGEWAVGASLGFRF